jgi:hypothetical protein
MSPHVIRAIQEIDKDFQCSVVETEIWHVCAWLLPSSLFTVVAATHAKTIRAAGSDWRPRWCGNNFEPVRSELRQQLVDEKCLPIRGLRRVFKNEHG